MREHERDLLSDMQVDLSELRARVSKLEESQTLLGELRRIYRITGGFTEACQLLFRVYKFGAYFVRFLNPLPASLTFFKEVGLTVLEEDGGWTVSGWGPKCKCGMGIGFAKCPKCGKTPE